MKVIMDIGFICLILLVSKSFFTSLTTLEYPRNVVFDEVHYGTICSLYQQGQFHLDEQPPAARILLCWMLPNHPNDYMKIWSDIDKEFPTDFPVWRARLIPAVCGILLPVLAYHIILALKFSKFSAIIGSFLIVFDNALTTQSKLFVPDSIVLFLQSLPLYLALSPSMWCMASAGAVVGLALASHYSSFISWILVFSLSLHKAWTIIINPCIPLKYALKRSLMYLLCSIFIPLTVYCTIFYLHFSLLPSSGPHNHMLSSAYQATLLNGPQVSARDITYGSHVTLRSVSKGCYLSSGSQNYPQWYKDGRASSRQQIVSCVRERDSHNWWLLAPPGDNGTGELNAAKVYDGSDIWLIHSITLKKLQTNFVGAPVSSAKHEVSCYLHHPEMKILPTWKIRIKIKNENKNWRALNDIVQFYHNETKTMLSVSNMYLPVMQSHREVMSDQDIYSWKYDDTEWIVEETLQKDSSSPIDNAEPASLGFWGNMLEVHILMWSISQSTSEHRFTSSPLSWPLAQSSIVYWYNSSTGGQLHLLGNPVSWCAGVVISILFGLLICVWALAKQRQLLNIKPDIWFKNIFAFALLGGGWLLHMIWLTAADRPMFLYAYLPALIYKHMLHACAVGTLCNTCGKYAMMGYCLLLVCIANTYESLISLTLGYPVTNGSQLERLRWWETWEILGIE